MINCNNELELALVEGTGTTQTLNPPLRQKRAIALFMELKASAAPSISLCFVYLSPSLASCWHRRLLPPQSKLTWIFLSLATPKLHGSTRTARWCAASPPHALPLFYSCAGDSVDRKLRWNADTVWLEHPQRGTPRCLLPCAPSLTRRLLEEWRRRARVRVHARPQLDSGLDRRRPAGSAPLCLLAGFVRNGVSVLLSHSPRCAKVNARAFTCPPRSATAHRLKEAR
jgi:hypothetical protein